ncbi:MAG: DUF2391 family protein [Candidatus Omnitrophica bacterium]|nr:DUF2391 family protein [Candidatus Omnitrophota bacterium]
MKNHPLRAKIVKKLELIMDKNKYKIKRIGGYLHKVIPIVDGTGKLMNTIIAPFMVEFKPRDVLQIIVGATILAIPVGLTEETWILAKELKMENVLLLGFISVLFISLFVYFNFYRFNLRKHLGQYLKRTIATYLLSLLVVGLLLTIIEKCPWGTDNILAIKRIIITAFPASMAATISDTMK